MSTTLERSLPADVCKPGVGQFRADVLRGLRAPRKKLLRERPGTGAHFHDDIARRDFAGIGDDANEVAVDHEILPEAMARAAAAGFGQNCLNLMFGLCHSPESVRWITSPAHRAR